jgi:hypothetical protein
MGRAEIERSEEVTLHRQRIHEHLEKMHRERKLLVELERQDKDTVPHRQILKNMLSTLDDLLSEHHQLVTRKIQKVEV